MRTGGNMNIRWCILLLTLSLFLGSAAVATAPASDPYFVQITIDYNETIMFADHPDQNKDGNWILLSGGNPVEIPDPLVFTYLGTNSSSDTQDGKQIDVIVNAEDYTEHSFNYPYDSHDMFTDVSGKNEVDLTFYGSHDFAHLTADVYITSTGPTQLKNAFDGVVHGDTSHLRNMLNSAEMKYMDRALGGNGDLTINAGTPDAGDYVAFVLLNTTHLPDPNDLAILSTTMFMVLEYDSNIQAPSETPANDSYRVDMELLNAPAGTYTYGVVMVHEDVYNANFLFESDGSHASTDLSVNGLNLIEGYKIAGVGLSNINRTIIQEMLTEGMGPGNGTVSVKTTDSTSTSIPVITDDLKEGDYILLAAVYHSGEKLVAFQQTEITIPSPDIVDVPFFIKVNINDEENIIFAEHTDSDKNGNWIAVSGGEAAKLPAPISFTYNGSNKTTYISGDNNVTVTVGADNYTDHSFGYPYDSHDMFTNVSGMNNVDLTFYGTHDFAHLDVDIYITRTSPTQLKNVFDSVAHGNSTGLHDLLDSSEIKFMDQTLKGNGDITINTGALDAGDYVALVLLDGSHLPKNDLAILSMTAFEVLDYDCVIDATTGVEANSSFRIDIELLDAPNGTYTYGAMMIHEDQYRAELRMEFNGTKAGMDLMANSYQIIDGYAIAGIGLSNINQTTAQEFVNTYIGANNGTVSFKTTNSTHTSLPVVTDDLRKGNYILLIGTYHAGEKLVAFDQRWVTVPPGVEVPGKGGSGGTGEPGIAPGTTGSKPLIGGIATIDGDVIISIAIPEGVGSVVVKNIGDNPTDLPLEAYTFVNIDTGSNSKKNGMITFRIPSGWLEDNGLDTSDIALYRYVGGEWEELPTIWDGTVNEYEYFTARTEGFSYFAISTATPGTALESVPDLQPDTTVPDSTANRSNLINTIVALLLPALLVGLVVLTKRYVSKP